MPESEGMGRGQLAPLGLSNTPTNLCMALYCIVFNHISILYKSITIKNKTKKKIFTKPSINLLEY